MEAFLFKQELQTTTTLLPPENQEKNDLEMLPPNFFFKGDLYYSTKLKNSKLNTSLISSRNAGAQKGKIKQLNSRLIILRCDDVM